MCSVLSIFCLLSIIIPSTGNPVGNDTESFESKSPLQCLQNTRSTSNHSLFELLDIDRVWLVLARTKFVYGEETWNNVLMQTSTSNNGTTSLEFIGESSNGSCVNSEKGQIKPDEKSNRVLLEWQNQTGFLETVYIDEVFIHFILCYSIDSNRTDICAHHQSEQFVLQNNKEDNKNDTVLWLKSHCSSLNPDDFVLNDNSEKCLPFNTHKNVVEVDTIEQLPENNTKIDNQTYIDQDNDNVTVMSELDFTTRSNRTNRLEDLEEYYNNSTGNSTEEDRSSEVQILQIKPIVLLSTNVSVDNESETISVIRVQPIVLEPLVNSTVDVETPLLVLHRVDLNETSIEEVAVDDSETTENLFTKSLEKDNSTEVDVDQSTSIVLLTTEKPVVNDSTIAATVKSATESISRANETGTTLPETTIQLTTTEEIVSTTVVPINCPPLKDCPFDYCTVAHKLDNRGCPTCNCLYSNKSNINCPILTCQACLYGHHTDPNGCSVCQCQSRPYPPLGERCPLLNCEPCYFGTVKDEYNCDTCVCIRPNSQECPILNCTFGACKHGSIKDEDDCPTCDCLLPTNHTTEVNCSNPISCPPCHLGYVKDADGCETCQCKLRGSVSCVSLSTACHCDYGSYLNSDGCETCSCLPDPKNASRQACWELANQANSHNISGPMCTKDGSFYARQCDRAQSRCWCVTPTGILISGFDSRPEENINCACAVELFQVSSLRMIGHQLLCLPTGNYAPIQCDGRYCSCVDDNGTPIGPSVSVQNRDQLRCVGVYQQLHPERFLLHRTSVEQPDGSRLPYGMSSSLCLTHREQVRHANMTDDHILIPVCDASGLYTPLQCDQSERYCWCVDKKTGVEMDGTRRLNARPNCNTD